MSAFILTQERGGKDAPIEEWRTLRGTSQSIFFPFSTVASAGAFEAELEIDLDLDFVFLWVGLGFNGRTSSSAELRSTLAALRVRREREGLLDMPALVPAVAVPFILDNFKFAGAGDRTIRPLLVLLNDVDGGEGASGGCASWRENAFEDVGSGIDSR